MDQEKILLNINNFISSQKIKQSAIVKRSGMNKDKLSRILTNKQDLTLPDLESLAKALGREATTFVQSNDIKMNIISLDELPQPSFYMGEATDKRKSDSQIYSQLAERIHYLKTVATLNPNVLADF